MAEINTKRGSGKFTASITDATQADGSLTVDVGAGSNNKLWQFAVETSASATDGNLTISLKAFGATDYTDINTIINLDETPIILNVDALIESIKVTPDAFDSDKTYSVYIASV